MDGKASIKIIYYISILGGEKLITNNFAIDRKKENIGKTNKDIIKIYILL
jgi:hypothetical protein